MEHLSRHPQILDVFSFYQTHCGRDDRGEGVLDRLTAVFPRAWTLGRPESLAVSLSSLLKSLCSLLLPTLDSHHLPQAFWLWYRPKEETVSSIDFCLLNSTQASPRLSDWGLAGSGGRENFQLDHLQMFGGSDDIWLGRREWGEAVMITYLCSSPLNRGAPSGKVANIRSAHLGRKVPDQHSLPRLMTQGLP